MSNITGQFCALMAEMHGAAAAARLSRVAATTAALSAATLFLHPDPHKLLPRSGGLVSPIPVGYVTA